MKTEYKGHVKNGTVVLDEPCELPDGANVVVKAQAIEAFEPDWEAAWRGVGSCRDVEGRTDVSEHVDEILAEAQVREMEESYRKTKGRGRDG